MTGNSLQQRRGPGRPFQKGQSGNPSGRPKVVGEIVELARQHSAAAIAALVNIVQAGESEGARIAAAIALLDRAYGKPSQKMEHAGAEDSAPIRFKLIIGDGDGE